MTDASHPRSPRPITVWSIAPSVYLPAIVYEIGNGAITPVIALSALKLGASPTTAGYMLALLGVGQVLGDIPSSSLATRLGDRHAMMAAAGLAVVVLFGCFITPSLILFGAALLVLGMCNATYYLARQAYLTEVAPVELRARAISTLGGSHRIGLFIGPFIGALAIGLSGLRAAYVVAMITATAAAVLLLVIPDVDQPGDRPAARTDDGSSAYSMLRARWQLFATLGLAVLAVGAVRAARQTVLPLWAEHIGLSPETTSLVFGISSAVDMALFYPAGKVMDHFGRLAIVVPSMLVLGGSMLLLPLTHSLVPLTIVAMTMSFGNGLGSGIIQTIGADVSPAINRLRFLSLWRVMGDSGNAAGPVVVSLVATATTLAAGIVAIGSVGLIGAAGMIASLPRHSSLATYAGVRRTRARHLDADPRPGAADVVGSGHVSRDD
jgi:MFS family permease